MSYKSCNPLPRIGSKAWGWVKDKEAPVWTSPKTRLSISRYRSCHGGNFYQIDREHPDPSNDESLVRIDGTVSEAKRIAELLARRDWRREKDTNKD